MKPRTPTAILLFLSSYAPLGLIVITLDFEWTAKAFAHLNTVILIAIFSLLAGAIPFVLLRRLTGGSIYTIEKLSNKSGDLVNYTLPYLVTFVGLKLSEPASVLGFVFFMLLFGALTIKTQALWINPLLALRGFRLYEASVQTDGGDLQTILVLSENALKVGERCRADYLTEHQLYVTASIDGGHTSEADRLEDHILPDQED